MMEAKAITAAIGSAAPLFSAAKKYLTNSYYRYKEDAQAEIEAVIKLYRKDCLPAEKKHKSLSTLVVIPEGTETEKEYVLPVFFEMEIDNNENIYMPKNYREFKPNKDELDWLEHLGEDSPLLHPIEEMISYICEYQRARDRVKSIFGKTGYNYDPTNLFFEEFKSWLVVLSHVSELTQATLEVVRGRISYLSHIYSDSVFKPSKDHPVTQEMVVSHLNDILKNIVMPTISVSLQRESAREHFNRLKLNTAALIKNTIRYLFYVFSNDKDTPRAFIFAELRKPTTEQYRKVMDTTAGYLLRHLVSSSACCLVFPKSQESKEENRTVENILDNSFLNDRGDLVVPVIPALDPRIDVKTWYKFEEGVRCVPGILPVFRQREPMSAFLEAHAQVQRMCLFYLISDSLTDLAGDGGNILVYGFALTYVEMVLDTYKVLTDALQENLRILSEKADEFRKQIGSSEQNTPVNAWRERYKYSTRAKERIDKEFAKLQAIRAAVKGKIDAVNSKAYLETIKQKLNFFLTLVDSFAGVDQRLKRGVISQLSASVTALPLPAPPSNATTSTAVMSLSSRSQSSSASQLSTFGILGQSSSVSSVSLVSSSMVSDADEKRSAEETAKAADEPILTLDPKYCFKGHDKEVTAVLALSNDLFVSGSADDMICVWKYNGIQWELLKKIEAGQGGITQLAELSEHRFVSGGKKGTVYSWCAPDYQRQQLPDAPRNASVIAFAVYGNMRLACSTTDGTTMVWDVAVAGSSLIKRFDYSPSLKRILLSNSYEPITLLSDAARHYFGKGPARETFVSRYPVFLTFNLLALARCDNNNTHITVYDVSTGKQVSQNIVSNTLDSHWGRYLVVR